MNNQPFNLLLADDDPDDCLFFKDALEELPLSADLRIVNDGVQLMELLSEKEVSLPDALFLDLNMPLKNGFECLAEIKSNEELKNLPVIIVSTSFDIEAVNHLHELGAQYYIRKPGEFSELKKVIQQSLNLLSNSVIGQTAKERFVLYSK
ncbi:MAG: response regulator [Bacteroidota bacterium]|nr:response regulator [Bacteroidota bacterium]